MALNGGLITAYLLNNNRSGNEVNWGGISNGYKFEVYIISSALILLAIILFLML